MGRNFRFYQSGNNGEASRTFSTDRKCLTLENCIIFDMKSFQKKEEVPYPKFRVGDQRKFLGNIVTIREIMLDENQNIIYRVEIQNGRKVLIDQRLLEEESVWKERLSSENKSASSPESELVVQEKLAESSESELAVQEKLADPSGMQLMPEENLSSDDKTVEVNFDPSTVESFIRTNRNQVENQKGIKIEDILAFLNITSTAYDMTKFDAALRVYKFLVQNLEYDDILLELEQENIYRYATSENEVLKKTKVSSIVLHSLLSEVGVESFVVTLRNLKDKSIHNTVLLPFKAGYCFFDLEQERILQEQGIDELVPFFSRAGLGISAYSSQYEFLGILPQDETEELVPVPSVIFKNDISVIIMKSYGRNVPDLTYTSQEKIV